jgi:hypothetical protein
MSHSGAIIRKKMEDINMLNCNIGNAYFKEDCRIIDMRREYPGYNGATRWMVISDLTEEEILLRYEVEIRPYSPFVCITNNQFEPIRTSHSNDDKFRIRYKKYYDMYGYEDGVFETFHPDLVHDPHNEPDWSCLYESFELLSDVQKNRIHKRYFKDLQLEEIARQEGSSKQAISKSIRLAIIVMREFLKERGIS